MSIAVSEVYEAFKAAGVPDDKAMAAARAVIPGEQLALLATKSDIAEFRATTKSDLAEVRAGIGELRAATKTDIAELKASVVMWLVTTQLAQLLALVALLRFVVRP